MDDALTTAHRAWDERWANPPREQRWQIPEPLVVGLPARLRARGATRAVDVGCGLGRHARFLAAQGLWVHGLDAAPRGLRFASDSARDADLAAATWSQAMFTQLPLRDASFDVAIAWNVVYHGDAEVVRTAIAELARVLRPDAIVVATMLSTRHRHHGLGVEVRPSTFADPNAEGDRAHPHYFCDERALRGLWEPDFELEQLDEREHGKPRSWHWELVAHRTP